MKLTQSGINMKLHKTLLIGIFFSFFLVLLSTSLVSAGSWWNSSWSYNQKVTIDGGTSAITNFPVYLNVTFNANMKADFSDLRFIASDNTTVLPYEIDYKTNSNSAGVWVLVPTLYAGNKNNTIYMYYGNPTAPDGQNPSGVWIDYIGVWHFSEGTGNSVKDSSSLSNNMSCNGAGVWYSGNNFGKAYSTGGGVTGMCNSTNTYNLGSATHSEIWFEKLGNAGADKFQIYFGTNTGTVGEALGGSEAGNTWYDEFAGAANTWGSYNIGPNMLYHDYDGVTVHDSQYNTSYYTNASAAKSFSAGNYPLVIGGRYGQNQYANVTMDELRLANVSFSQNYLNRTYQNTNLSSFTFGSEQTGDTSYPTFFNLTDNSGTLNNSGIAVFNVTVNNSNGTVIINLNGTSYTANSLGSGVYNYSLNLTSYGNFTYYWLSYGNGTNHLTNVSANRTYVGPQLLPPSAPSVYSPNQSNFSFGDTVVINYTQSVSPNGLPITHYNISLLNPDRSFNRTIIANNSLNLGYVWTANVIGSFVIGVNAYDNSSQNASGVSSNFTIYKAASLTSLTFDKTSPQEYGNLITPNCSLITGNGNVSLTNGTNNVAEKLGVGNWTFNCSYAGNENYSSSSQTSVFTIIQNSSYSLIITGASPITYLTTTNVVGSNCPSEVNCSLDKANAVYSVGVTTFNYSTPGNTNYSSKSITLNVTINQNPSYYNWYKQYIYDSYPGTVINSSLWINTTTGYGRFAQINNTYIEGNQSNQSSSSYDAYGNGTILETTALPNSFKILNLSFNAFIYATGTFGDTYVTILGNLLNSVHANSGTASDNSTYLIINNGSGFNMYNDGAFVLFANANSSNVSIWTRSESTPSSYFILNPISYYYRPMNITINTPNNSASFLPGDTIVFNVTANSYISTLSNISFYIDDVLQHTDAVPAGNYNFTDTFNTTLSVMGTHDWYVTVCDNYTQDNGIDCINSSVYTVNINNSQIMGMLYNATTFETASESFIVNISSNHTSDLSALFNYNGTSYSTTRTLSGNIATFSTSLDIPALPGIKNFYWTIIDSSGAANNTNTTIFNQVVNGLTFSLCTANQTALLNFTFKDENNLTDINGTMNPLTAYYYLGSGLVNKTLTFSNTTVNPTYTFCSNTTNFPLKTSLNILYAGAAGALIYPARNFYGTYTLANATISQPLYLLSSSDGVSMFIQVIDQNTNKVSGATVTVTRVVNSNTITVSQASTGNDGGATFWLSPNFAYTFSITKTGCSAASVTVTPSQPQYTVTMQCGTNLVVDNYIHSTIGGNGLTWTHSPFVGFLYGKVVNQTPIKFDYQIVSSKGNIQRAKFELTNQTLDDDGNRVIVNSTSLSVPSTNCTASGCYMSLYYTPHVGETLWGKYYVDIGSGYVLVEADAKWMFITTNASSGATVKNVLNDFTGIFSPWTSTTGGWTQSGIPGHCISDYTSGTILTNYTTYDSCTSAGAVWYADDANRQEYSRIVFFFLALAMILSLFNKFTGYDTMYPGTFIVGIALMILILSVYNGIIPHCSIPAYSYYTQCVANSGTWDAGYFYYNNLIPERFAGSTWINNYIFAISILFVAGGIGAGILAQRRA